MKKPWIGLTAGRIINEEHPWSPSVYGQSDTYFNAIIHAGGIPLMIPLTDDMSQLDEYYARCDGFLFSGGNDIDPQLYGQEQSEYTVKVDRQRDDQELYMLKKVIREDRPTLGICRGMQLLNVACGGTLYQHVEVQIPGAQNHHASTDKKDIADIAHTLIIEPDSILAQLLNAQTIGTNAHHHQAVHEPGKGLKVIAKTSDGVVEAMELSGKTFILGVQSHPESLEMTAEPRWRELFVALIQHATVK